MESIIVRAAASRRHLLHSTQIAVLVDFKGKIIALSRSIVPRELHLACSFVASFPLLMCVCPPRLSTVDCGLLEPLTRVEGSAGQTSVWGRTLRVQTTSPR